MKIGREGERGGRRGEKHVGDKRAKIDISYS